MNSVSIAALYTFCAHYHSGQWSRGYRLLCMAERAWERRSGIGVRLDYWEGLVANSPDSAVTVAYNRLVSEHAASV